MNSKIYKKIFVIVWKSTSGVLQALLSFHGAVSKINKNPKILCTPFIGPPYNNAENIFGNSILKHL